MATRSLLSFPTDFPMIVLRVVEEKQQVHIPLRSRGQEINLAIRLRHYLKILRDLPIGEIPESHLQVRQAIENFPVYVKGGGKDRGGPYGISVQPYDEDNPLARALAGWSPKPSPYAAASPTQSQHQESTSTTGEEPISGRGRNYSQSVLDAYEQPWTNEEIWERAQDRDNPMKYAMLSQRQKNLVAEWRYRGGPPKNDSTEGSVTEVDNPTMK